MPNVLSTMRSVDVDVDIFGVKGYLSSVHYCEDHSHIHDIHVGFVDKYFLFLLFVHFFSVSVSTTVFVVVVITNMNTWTDIPCQ